MKELGEVAQAWEDARRQGREAILATVVQVRGSTYRRPGARMLLSGDGRLAGSISGGCLEGDILKKAAWRTQDGRPALVTYDSTDEDEDVIWGFGLGCNGVVQVLLERLAPDQPNALSFVGDCLHRRRSGVLATVFAADGAATVPVGARLTLVEDGESQDTLNDAALSSAIREDALDVLRQGVTRTQTYSQSGGQVHVLLELIRPTLPLVVFGAGHDAVPLVRIARELGWHVTVVDTRAAQPRPDRFPLADTVLACPPEAVAERLALQAHTAAVVMTHHYPDDRSLLQTLLTSPVGYIGQLGPRKRTERLLAEIRDGGQSISEEQLRCLHGPIGLDIGADNPEEIALSIVAEIQATRAGRQGGLLRERQEPLHPRASAPILSPETETEIATCALSG